MAKGDWRGRAGWNGEKGVRGKWRGRRTREEPQFGDPGAPGRKSALAQVKPWEAARSRAGPPALTRCRKLRRSRSGGVAAMITVTFRPAPLPSGLGLLQSPRGSGPAHQSLAWAGPEVYYGKQFEPEPIRSPRSKTDKHTSQL